MKQVELVKVVTQVYLDDRVVILGCIIASCHLNHLILSLVNLL